MTDKERFTGGLEFYPKLVEDARIWAEAGMAERLNIIIPVDNVAAPDPVALETARRVCELGCNASFAPKGRHILIFFGALPEEEE
jgi:hypothetical protein